MNEDFSGAILEFELDELHRSKTKTILVSMSDKFNYEVLLNGNKVAYKLITENALMISVPAKSKSNRIEIRKIGEREKSLF
jgi:hypothetical protein